MSSSAALPENFTPLNVDSCTTLPPWTANQKPGQWTVKYMKMLIVVLPLSHLTPHVAVLMVWSQGALQWSLLCTEEIKMPSTKLLLKGCSHMFARKCWSIALWRHFFVKPLKKNAPPFLCNHISTVLLSLKCLCPQRRTKLARIAFLCRNFYIFISVIFFLSERPSGLSTRLEKPFFFLKKQKVAFQKTKKKQKKIYLTVSSDCCGEKTVHP